MVLNLNFTKRGKEFITNIIVVFVLFVSGLAMAITYYIMNAIQDAFLSVDCLIPQNSLVDTCQEWFALALYPVLNLKSVLIYGNYFLIFGIVFCLFFMGFRTKKHPVLLIVHIISSIIIGYLSIEIANIYRTLLQNEVIFDMLIPFPIYNKIMLYYPQFMFFVIFLSGLMGFMGVFKNVGQFKQGNEDLG